MKRLWIVGIVLCGTTVLAQVRLVVPQSSYQSHGVIRARVINQTQSAISICLEAGQWSMNGTEFEATPIPFFAQAPGRHRWKIFFRKRWVTLLIGPDIGSIRVPIVFSTGESREFPFRLSDEGPKFRLLLYYWKGERDNICSGPPQGAKKAVSNEFQLTALNNSVTASAK